MANSIHINYVKTPPCPLCKKADRLQITDEEFKALESGAFVQDALPERSADFREQVISGTHPEC